MSIPKLSPELMFKQLERLEQRLKVAKNAQEAKAIYERITVIEAFIDNCALATLSDAAADLKIDTRLFDLPLLTSFLQLPEGAAVPEQMALDFHEPLHESKEDNNEGDPVELEEILEQTELELDYENQEINRIMNALYTGLAGKDNFEKHMEAAVNVLRKKIQVPAEVDDFSIIRALMKPKPLHELPKFEEFAKKLYKIGLEDGHALNCIIEVKSRLKKWSDDSIANMVRTLISTVASGDQHHMILDDGRKKISELIKNQEFISKMAELWPTVKYVRKEKSTGNIVEEMLSCTIEKAAGYHMSHLYGLCSLKQQAMLANRKIYVEKGYPAA